MATKKEVIKTVAVKKVDATEFNKLCKKLSKVGNLQKKLDSIKKEISSELLEMCENDARYETDAWSLLITFMPPSEVLDTKKLKEEKPKIFEKFKKIKNGFYKLNPPVKKSSIDIGLIK